MKLNVLAWFLTHLLSRFFHTDASSSSSSSSPSSASSSSSLASSASRGGAATTTTTTKTTLTRPAFVNSNTPLLLPAAASSNSSDTSLLLHRQGQQQNQQQDVVCVVTHPNGSLESVSFDSILAFLLPLTVTTATSTTATSTNVLQVSLDQVVRKTVAGLVPQMSRAELVTLVAETAASLATQHYDYGVLAARVLLQHNIETTPETFSEAMEQLELLHPNLLCFIRKHAATLNSWTSSAPSTRMRPITSRGRVIVDHHAQDEHDLNYQQQQLQPRLTYLGFSTLLKSYLLKDKNGAVVERPQYLYLRVALGIHFDKYKNNNKNHTSTTTDDDDDDNDNDDQLILDQAYETYQLMCQGVLTHASPTLFHAGTKHGAQLSSCFLVQITDDSIKGIYETLQTCALVSKHAGGIGLAVSKIRARGTPIVGTGGISNGLVPMLRVYDATCRYVDQGGGKRPGAFAVYVEPWHADVYDVLQLKKNHGKEEQRARDLFYGLWIPDLFMERVYNDQMWSLMCPQSCPGLHECHGKDFVELYQSYERDGRYVRQVRARDLWTAILESQIETGTPYMLYKDACNGKSNHQHLGCISCSNLCTEIVQYTSPQEVAVCNLASLCLPAFVRSSQLYGSPPPASEGEEEEQGEESSALSSSSDVSFDHAALHRAVKIVTRNLNKIIDINHYPVAESQVSNQLHRPVGIGVSGLADAFVRLGLPFCSKQAKQLNEAIFETMYHAALEASAELAKRDGWYPSFPGSPTSEGRLQYHMWGTTDDETPSRRYFAGKYKDGGNFRQHDYAEDVMESKGYDWEGLRRRIQKTGLRNSLLLAPMPTASTSQILGVNECFEPFSSNLYIRRVKAGEFIYTNPHLLQDLSRLGLWTPAVRNQLMRDGGSVQNIAEIPQRLKDLYKTVWEISMKDIIDMAADRGKFVDQSQSLNLFVADPNLDRLTAMHFYAWKKGLKTGMYYLRTKPAVNAIQYTVDKEDPQKQLQQHQPTPLVVDDADVCTSCSV